MCKRKRKPKQKKNKIIGNNKSTVIIIPQPQPQPLLCHDDDTVAHVLENLDARALLLLGKVSKYFQSMVRKDGVLRAAMLKSFPGITNIPSNDVVEYSYYQESLEHYHRARYLGDVFSVSEQFHFISRHADDKPFPPEEFDYEIYLMYQCIFSLLNAAKGRELFLERIKGWRKSLKPGSHVNAGAILDRVSTIVLTCFNFEQWESIIFGKPMQIRISTDELSIPEVVRHIQRINTAAAAAAAEIQ